LGSKSEWGQEDGEGEAIEAAVVGVEVEVGIDPKITGERKRVKLMLKKKVAFLVILVVTAITAAAPVRANSAANLGGQVTAKNTYYGPQGYVSVIELTVDTMDGLTWTAVCRRSNQTLGWCSGASMGNQVQVQGVMSGWGVVEVDYLGVKF